MWVFVFVLGPLAGRRRRSDKPVPSGAVRLVTFAAVVIGAVLRTRPELRHR